MKQRNTMSHGLIAAAFVAGCTLALNAATVYYTGPGADLADPSNWSGTWTSEDTLFISTNNNVAFPEGGFTLSKDMPASSKIVMRCFPASAVNVECGGHSLNTAILDYGNLHTSSAEKSIPAILSGGFTGVGKIVPSSNWACMYLTNGTFSTANGFYIEGHYYNYLHILKGAELVVEDVNRDQGCGLGPNAFSSFVDIDAGCLHVVERTPTDPVWNRSFWSSSFAASLAGVSILKIRNGGKYVDDSTAPADHFHRCSVLIDGGSYIVTNSTGAVARHVCWCPKRENLSFAVTNGTLKIALFGTGNSGEYTIFNSGVGMTDGATCSRITFHNSQEIFGNKKAILNEWRGRIFNSLDGMVIARTSDRNSLVLSGPENVFRSGWFVIGGRTNTAEVADGSFSVTNRFMAYDGYDSVVRFTGGVSSIENMYVDPAATNFTVEVAGDAAVNIAELKLDRATKFRFVVPDEGFAEAPVKCGTTSANGNFRFEFDMSGFTWPDSVSMIPLVYDEGGFAEWAESGAPLDVAALNEAYAESLPVGSGGKCHFKLGMNGKLLSLSISNGLILYVR